MFQAYFESIKYVGHLLPISFLRIFIGYYYVQKSIYDWKAYIVSGSSVADRLFETLNSLQVPYWYRLALTEHFIPNWNIYAFVFVGLQLAIGLSYILGYVVRPIAVLAFIFTLNMMIVSVNHHEFFFKLMMACHVLLAWVGAGRCLGFDYYFYKRYRGLWW